MIIEKSTKCDFKRFVLLHVSISIHHFIICDDFVAVRLYLCTQPPENYPKQRASAISVLLVLIHVKKNIKQTVADATHERDSIVD